MSPCDRRAVLGVIAAGFGGWSPVRAAPTSDFDEWLGELKREARKRGISPDILDQAFAGEQQVRYVDIGDRLVDSRGLLTAEMSEDGLHLSLAAYQIWADALKPVLVERLGEALDVDLAPAATGNPAAR